MQQQRVVLLVMVDVANNDGEQTEEEYNTGCIDDWVQGLDARREILHTAEVLQDRWGVVRSLSNMLWIILLTSIRLKVLMKLFKGRAFIRNGH